MKRSIPADTCVALVLLLAGGLVLDNLLSADFTGPYGSPATLPTATAVVFVGLSFLLLVGSLRRRTAPPAEAAPTLAGALRVVALTAATALFIAAMPLLGYILASVLFMIAAGLVFGNRNPLSLLAAAVATPLAIYVFFEKVMLVFLPTSHLFG